MNNNQTTTVEANGYTFTTDQNGTVTAKGDLQSQTAARNSSAQVKAGGSARLADDDGGHLVAARFNGPAIDSNLSAQNSNLNRGSFKSVENAENRALQSGAKISTERIAFVSNDIAQDGSRRPDAYMINDTITHPNGQTENVHHSFSNLSAQKQTDLNSETAGIFYAHDMPNPGDGLRAQMSDEEYAELMESTDQYLPSFRDEYAEWDTSTANQNANAAAQTNAPAAANAVADSSAAQTDSAFTVGSATVESDSAVSVDSDSDVSTDSSDASADSSDGGSSADAGADSGDGGGASPSND